MGSEDECFDALRTKADIHTIGRERVAWLKAQFLDDKGRLKYRWPWDMVVIDESQSFKSQGSQRWKSLVALRPYFPRLAELSGTPAPNGYGDLWSQFYLLDKGRRLGNSESSFRERWFTPPAGMFTKWLLKDGAHRLVHDAVRDMVLSLREEDYLSLPPIIDNFIRCTLSPAAMATYKEMAREYVAEVKGQKLTAVNAGVLDGKLLQLANGACYTGEDKKWVVFHDEKVLALDETLEAMPGKALIAYGYQHDLERISKVVQTRARLDGQDLRHSTNPILRSTPGHGAKSTGEYSIPPAPATDSTTCTKQDVRTSSTSDSPITLSGISKSTPELEAAIDAWEKTFASIISSQMEQEMMITSGGCKPKPSTKTD